MGAKQEMNGDVPHRGECLFIQNYNHTENNIHIWEGVEGIDISYHVGRD